MALRKCPQDRYAFISVFAATCSLFFCGDKTTRSLRARSAALRQPTGLDLDAALVGCKNGFFPHVWALANVRKTGYACISVPFAATRSMSGSLYE